MDVWLSVQKVPLNCLKRESSLPAKCSCRAMDNHYSMTINMYSLYKDRTPDAAAYRCPECGWIELREVDPSCCPECNEYVDRAPQSVAMRLLREVQHA